MERTSYPTIAPGGKGERRTHVCFTDGGKDIAVGPGVDQEPDLGDGDTMPLSDGLGVCRLEQVLFCFVYCNQISLYFYFDYY